MMLKELLSDCGEYRINGTGAALPDTEIKDVAYDSRKVSKGALFVAIEGEKYDGHDYMTKAIHNGAVAVVYEHSKMHQDGMEIQTMGNISGSHALFIGVPDTRKMLACIANNYCERPSERLILAGVTGTNGKTTTTYILKSILDTWGKSVGLIGTIQHMIKETAFPAQFTTPEALEFQKLLKDMLKAGCTHVVSEVSSHALVQDRVAHTIFRAAAFTNLTRDHLDFHSTMNAYFEAKQKLFHELLGKRGTAVINIDDAYGEELYTELKNEGMRKVLTFGMQKRADITATNMLSSFGGIQFVVSHKNKTHNVQSRLTGTHNVYNILTAIGLSLALDIPWRTILAGIDRAQTVRGRFEKVDLGQTFLCIVDYAHSEDSLERLITTARELSVSEKAGKIFARPRIITVFGCGGDRDRGKRPRMGKIATHLSDFVVITSDNPRSEYPIDIIKDIEKGAVRNNYLIEPDRKTAIQKALDMTGDGDVLLVAGKGHEEYQEIQGVRYQFSDRAILEEGIRYQVMKRKNM